MSDQEPEAANLTPPPEPGTANPSPLPPHDPQTFPEIYAQPYAYPPPPPPKRGLHPAACLAIDFGIGLGALIPLVILVGLAVILSRVAGLNPMSAVLPVTAVLYAGIAMLPGL